MKGQGSLTTLSYLGGNYEEDNKYIFSIAYGINGNTVPK